MRTDDIIDIVLTIVILAIFTPILIANAIPLFKSDTGGFNVQIEKAALDTSGEIAPAEPPFNSHDVLFMMTIADRYTPNPKAISINGVDITLSETFFVNRTTALMAASTAMPTVSDMGYKLHVGPMGLRKWVFTND
jgi:hypothetical protein